MRGVSSAPESSKQPEASCAAEAREAKPQPPRRSSSPSSSLPRPETVAAAAGAAEGAEAARRPSPSSGVFSQSVHLGCGRGGRGEVRGRGREKAERGQREGQERGALPHLDEDG